MTKSREIFSKFRRLFYWSKVKISYSCTYCCNLNNQLAFTSIKWSINNALPIRLYRTTIAPTNDTQQDKVNLDICKRTFQKKDTEPIVNDSAVISVNVPRNCLINFGDRKQKADFENFGVERQIGCELVSKKWGDQPRGKCC